MDIRKKKIAFLLLMSMFGCLGPVVRGISLPTPVIVWARAAISAAALAVFLLLSRRGSRGSVRSYLLPMLFSGVLLAVDWIGLFASYRYTTIATATLCYYISPVLVLIGAAVYLKEALSKRQLICILIAFIGMAFVSGVAENGLPALSEIRGVLLAFLGAAAYAAIILINRKYPGDPLLKTFLQLATAALIMTGYLLWNGDFRGITVSGKDVVLLLVMGILMTALAYIAYFHLMAQIPSSSVAFFSFADPVVAVIISIFFLGEPFSLYAAVSALMIIGAAAYSERTP